MVHETILVIVGTVAALDDLRRGKISNGLTYPVAVFGLAYAMATGQWPGLKESLLGMVAGFVPFFLLYLAGGMGGGDVKLMASIGALMGVSFVVNTMVTSVLMGGLIAILILIWEGQLFHGARYLVSTVGHALVPGVQPVPLDVQRQIPFGVAICLGAFVTLVARWKGLDSPAQLLPM